MRRELERPHPPETRAARRATIMSVPDALDKVEVYIGRHRIGHYIKQGGEWLALNDDDKALGRFPERKGAIAAIVGASAPAKVDTAASPAE